MTSLPGRIGPYAIERRLGAGGMGVVYLGRDGRGEAVAVKVIRPELAGDPRTRARLEREVRAARTVPRYCTAALLDADLDGPLPYLATEYVEGPTLDVALMERGVLAGDELTDLALGVALALGAVHGSGVLHRDLKPSNIILSAFGPRVIDFGIAQLADSRTRLTDTGAVIGSLVCMAPEQLRAEPLTPAVDVFAWACVVFYAATGRYPFGADSGIRQRVLHDDPDLGQLRPGLAALVEKALAKDPRDRPTADDLVAGLGTRTHIEETATFPRTEPVVSVRPAPPGRRHARRGGPWTLVALGVVALLAGGTGWWWLARHDGVLGSQGDRVTALTIGTLRDGRPVAVSGAADGMVAYWDLKDRKGIGDVAAYTRTGCEIGALATGTVDGRAVVLSGGDASCSTGLLGLGQKHDYSIIAMDLATRAHLFTLPESGGGVSEMALGTVNGVPMAISYDGSARLWNLRTRKEAKKALRLQNVHAVGFRDGRPLVLAHKGKTVVATDLLTGKAAGPGIGLAAGGAGADLATLAGRTVIVTYAPRRTDGPDLVRMWDLTTGRATGEPLEVPADMKVIGTGMAGDRPYLMARDRRYAQYAWSLATRVRTGPLKGHKDIINDVAFGQIDGRPVAISAGWDKKVRIWNLK
ncbi:serine/threonine-protein kinase [Spirillospora sp. NPDC047279]|uniref:WD40 repeat domain-containing serine/threonine protein kinase n=1 Tax=Spirillospora sp. NPDC047279 TaxID=3155478 RepID=UPI0033D04168